MERIGKIEKWILTTCYQKTVLKELPESWKGTGNNSKHYPDSLTKSDILLNYFKLEPSIVKQSYGINEKLKTTIQYKKALVTISRTTKNLQIKNLISEYTITRAIYYGGRVYKLTDTGKEKAIKLLNDNTQQLIVNY